MSEVKPGGEVTPGCTYYPDGRQAPDLLRGQITAIYTSNMAGRYTFVIDYRYKVRVKRRYNQSYKVGDHVTVEARYVGKPTIYHVWNEITMAITASGSFKPIFRDLSDTNYVNTL